MKGTKNYRTTDISNVVLHRDWKSLYSVVMVCTYCTIGGTKNNCCFINWELVINIHILYLNLIFVWPCIII